MRIAIGLLLSLVSFLGFSQEIIVKDGSGKFSVKGGGNHSELAIEVYYHKPSGFNKNTKVLFVIPGAGRNGWSYRDSWVEASEKHNVLVLSPSYSEEFYPRFWNYNLACMIDEVEINKERTGLESFKMVKDPDEWIFNDFDRIFNTISETLGITADGYDMFGHSAGGQILHRYAIFNQNNKARRILASNSGWYTEATFEEEFPYSLENSPFSESFYRKIFESKLIIFLGELDNENETRGDLVRNDTVDKQGTHRLARGKHFFEGAKDTATSLGVVFNWEVQTVPGVGHDYRKMGQAAAEFLYGK